MTISNEQLKKENDVLKNEIIKLRAENIVMKDNSDKQRDQIRQLRTEVDMITGEIVQLKKKTDDLERGIGTNQLEPLLRTRQKSKVSQ